MKAGKEKGWSWQGSSPSLLLLLLLHAKKARFQRSELARQNPEGWSKIRAFISIRSERCHFSTLFFVGSRKGPKAADREAVEVLIRSSSDMAKPMNICVGSLVWVVDNEAAWMDGEVLDIKGEEIKISCTNGKTVTANVSNIYPKDPEAPPCGVDDMTKLAYLHEPGTYTGNILIAVNPFRKLPHLYDSHMMGQYKGASFGELSPHPFAVADACYRQMMNEGISQSILVSGESGAGKTESTKLLMRYLAYMGGRAAAEGRSVEQQVLESNPVLEAFGNAKTVRNNNSSYLCNCPEVYLGSFHMMYSRFGKFVEIQFDQRGRISGAAIRTYLLERSRVCQISDPERNYHCFYMLCSAPPEEAKRYKLGNPRTFHYLNQSNCYELDGVDDSKEYVATRRAMDVVGISNDEQEGIFRVVAAILHLGNIEFSKGKEIDSSEPKDEKSRFHLKTAAELFMCDEKALEDSLCKRVIVTRDETITKSLDPESAALSRDALAKIVYSRLFDWLVNKINSSIGQDPNSKFLIGVLDIYGFESFKTNRCLTGMPFCSCHSIGQVLAANCMEGLNVCLAVHLPRYHVFKMEQEEYTKEEINWSYIEFIDNQDVLDLIEKKPGGIVALLDEAWYVTYQTDLFLDKNKDYVVAEHQALLCASKCLFVSGLFPPLAEDSSKSSKFSSIGSRFKQQLQALLETLSSTEPHYIRCVKPNNLLKPAIFENINVLQQLRCGGVMEAIRISCAGYPTRRTFCEFLDRFSILAPEVLDGSCDEVAACKSLLEKVDLKGYQIGKTKVFLRAGQMAELDARRSEVLGRSAAIIQRKVRSHLARKTLRGMAARNELKFRRQTRAAIIIQSNCRRYIARIHYQRTKKAAITTQCAWRGRVARRELRKLKMASRETGALQAAKNKLEKQVEELTWRLQLEKRMRADMEEARNQENAKLQSALHEMEQHFKEAKEMLVKEQEAGRKAAEQVPVIQEVPVIDSAMVEKLTAENEKLKAMVSSLEEKIDQAERKYEETHKVSEERLKQAMDAESKIIQLKTAMQRLEEKLSDMESEDHGLQQQALFSSPIKPMSEHLAIPRYKEVQNTPYAKKEDADSDNKLKRFQIERQHESVDALIKCVSQNIGFSHGKPIAAFTIYKCLIHWRSFEAEKTSVFDRLIQVIGSEIEIGQAYDLLFDNQLSNLRMKSMYSTSNAFVFRSVVQSQEGENNEHLAYWLSNTSALLFLLQKSLKAGGAAGATPSRKPAAATSLFGRMAQGFRSSPSSNSLLVGNLDVVRQVEAKYPALLFKQQLTAYVEKIYGMVRDNLKKQLSKLLPHCIQVPPMFIQKIFMQIFSHMNVQLFNSLLLRRECCTFSNGEYVKAGLAELELWCCQVAKEEFAGSSWDELKHIRQSVGFLHAYTLLAFSPTPPLLYCRYLLIPLCFARILSVQQLYRICTNYWDDKYGTKSVNADVISSMRILMTEDSSDAASDAFLLDDNSGIPFSVDELSNALQEKDFSDVKPAPELLENIAFQFLLE
ncbi:hypothetical protein ACLOJK_037596 [Asimina triloba]